MCRAALEILYPWLPASLKFGAIEIEPIVDDLSEELALLGLIVTMIQNNNIHVDDLFLVASLEER
jgi:hypothetical protein